MTHSHLIVFVTSADPNPYVNAICHAVLNLGVERVSLISISEHGYESESSVDDAAQRIGLRVNAQLSTLASGKCIVQRDGSAAPETISLPAGSDPSIYQKVRRSVDEGGITTKVVRHERLYGYLRQELGSGPCVVDVTGLKKNLLVDVLVTCIALKHLHVCTFEFIGAAQPVFGERSLIHNLRHQQSYIYRNLMDGRAAAAAIRSLRRMGAVAWTTTIGLSAAAILLSLYGPQGALVVLLSIVGSLASIVGILWSRGDWERARDWFRS